MSLRSIRPRSTKGSMSRAHAQRSQSRKLPRRGEKEREASGATASRWDWSQSRLSAEFEKKPCVAIVFGKRVHRDEDGPHVSGVHCNPDVADLSRILVLLDLHLKIAAHSVKKCAANGFVGTASILLQRKTPVWQDCGAAFSSRRFDARSFQRCRGAGIPGGSFRASLGADRKAALAFSGARG
jgi:hypothetical protein